MIAEIPKKTMIAEIPKKTMKEVSPVRKVIGELLTVFGALQVVGSVGNIIFLSTSTFDAIIGGSGLLLYSVAFLLVGSKIATGRWFCFKR